MSLVVNDELTMNTDRVRRDLYGSLRYSYSAKSEQTVYHLEIKTG